MLFVDLRWSQQVQTSSKTKENNAEVYKYTHIHSPLIESGGWGVMGSHLPPAKEHGLSFPKWKLFVTFSFVLT